MGNRLLSLAMGLVLLPLSLSAAVITVDSVTGFWDNITGKPSNLSGSGTNQIKWGNPTGKGGQSGYSFVGNAPTLFPVSVGTPFSLGLFTHTNQPVTGNSITGARLNTTISLTIDGVQLKNLHFAYDFTHTETPNVAGSCPAGSASVCDDIVKVTNNVLISDVFTINGVDYTISILGFQMDGTAFSDFLTRENQQNMAYLQGVITAARVGVPEPSTYCVLGSFLLMGAFIAHRRKKSVA